PTAGTLATPVWDDHMPPMPASDSRSPPRSEDRRSSPAGHTPTQPRASRLPTAREQSGPPPEQTDPRAAAPLARPTPHRSRAARSLDTAPPLPAAPPDVAPP